MHGRKVGGRRNAGGLARAFNTRCGVTGWDGMGWPIHHVRVCMLMCVRVRACVGVRAVRDHAGLLMQVGERESVRARVCSGWRCVPCCASRCASARASACVGNLKCTGSHVQAMMCPDPTWCQETPSRDRRCGLVVLPAASGCVGKQKRAGCEWDGLC